MSIRAPTSVANCHILDPPESCGKEGEFGNRHINGIFVSGSIFSLIPDAVERLKSFGPVAAFGIE